MIPSGVWGGEGPRPNVKASSSPSGDPRFGRMRGGLLDFSPGRWAFFLFLLESTHTLHPMLHVPVDIRYLMRRFATTRHAESISIHA